MNHYKRKQNIHKVNRTDICIYMCEVPQVCPCLKSKKMARWTTVFSENHMRNLSMQIPEPHLQEF